MAITKEDIKFLGMIDEMEPKANCLRANIAALIAKDGEILVKHTNNWHPETSCEKLGCIRNIQKIESGTKREVCFGLCAEQWCVALAAKEGISLKGATIYVTKHPCRVCESLIAESGIIRVVFQEGYPDLLPSFDLFEKKGRKVEQGPNTDKKDPERLKADSI
jgi:dCMP deaminase